MVDYQRNANANGEGGGGEEEGSSVAKIRVVVRVRPELDNERGAGKKQALGFGDEGQSITLNGEKGQKEYIFNQILTPEAEQDDIYRSSGVGDMVRACLGGYHATVFAYGQTGSGKTHTMDGLLYAPKESANGNGGGDTRGQAVKAKGNGHFSSQGPGVTPRCIADIFSQVKERQARDNNRKIYRIHCSYVQIYRENVYDLLNPAAVQPKGLIERDGRSGAKNLSEGSLRMRWSNRDGFFLENLFQIQCENEEEAMRCLHTGSKSKVMASHQLNMQSSRSHAIFTMHVSSYESTTPEVVVNSKFSLVDLAGSERAKTTGATAGQLKQESVAINKSLFTLRKVIKVLADVSYAEDEGKRLNALQHVPYRESKLTSILKDSLGGHATTLMIACLAPCDRFHDENVSTLEYASLTKSITNRLAVNEDPKTKLIRQLRKEVAFLRDQIENMDGTQRALPEDNTAPRRKDCTNAQQRGTRGKVEDGGKIQEPTHTLNVRYVETSKKLEEMKGARDLLMMENTDLRERLNLLEAIVCMPSAISPEAADVAKTASEMHTASAAVMQELLDVRRQNEELIAREEERKQKDELRRMSHERTSNTAPQRSRSTRGEALNRLKSTGRQSKSVKADSLLSVTELRSALRAKGNVTSGSDALLGTGRLSSTGKIKTAIAMNHIANRASTANGTDSIVEDTKSNPESRLAELMKSRSALARGYSNAGGNVDD